MWKYYQKRVRPGREQLKKDQKDKEGDVGATENLEGTAVKGSMLQKTWQRAIVANKAV